MIKQDDETRRKLLKIYSERPQDGSNIPTTTGRRKPKASEIARVIGKEESREEDFPPTEKDLEEKGDD